MLKKCILSTLGITIISSFSTFAMVFGGSNLPLNRYPEFTSYYYNTYNMSAYELDQMKYDVQRYLENGNNDIRRIQEAQQEAIEKYNQAVREYNSRQGYY